MRLRKRSRERSWTLSRFATDGCRIPSSGPSGTSVDRPRMVEVTGAMITEWRSRPNGSRVRTMTGRVLSRSASQTSPRRTSAVTRLVGVQGFPIGVVSQATSVDE